MSTKTKPRERVDQEYNLFEGTYREQMPLLVAQGYKPATAEQIIQGRLEDKISHNTYYNSATEIFYAGNKQDKFKILPYSEALARVNKETPLYDGGIEKTEEDYEQIEAREFTRKDIITGRRLTEEEAIEHQGWLALANNNQELLQKYIQSIFKQVKDNYQENEAMGFYIRDPQEVPNIRAVCLGRLVVRSDAYDWGGLSDYARFVGVREKSAEGTRAEKSEYVLFWKM